MAASEFLICNYHWHSLGISEPTHPSSVQVPTLTVKNSYSSSSPGHIHGRNESPGVIYRIVTFYCVQAIPRLCTSDYVQIPIKLTDCRLVSTYKIKSNKNYYSTSPNYTCVLHILWIQVFRKNNSKGKRNQLTDVKRSAACPWLCYRIKHITIFQSLLTIWIRATKDV